MPNSLIWLIAFLAFISGLYLLLRAGIRKINTVQLKENGEILSSEHVAASGEPQIPKASVTPDELGAQFIKWLQTEAPSLPLNVVPADRFTTEFVYLQTFAFDLAAYLKLGDSYEKKVVLDVFWDYISGAGVYTETFQLRMLRYTDAVKCAKDDDIYQALGLAFAETCGTLGEDSIVKAGADIVRNIVNRINSLFNHIEIDTGTDTLSSLNQVQSSLN